MYSKSEFLPRPLRSYLGSIAPDEPEIFRRLRGETASHPRAIMQIPPEQGQLMALLVRAIAAKKTLEIGVFTGYSSLAVALALPEDGRVTALDASEEYTAVARRYWREADVDYKVDLRIGPAVESLEQLLREGSDGSYDFAFIDADKVNYDVYYEQCLRLLRPGGLMAVDNVLQNGNVYDPSDRSETVEAVRALNRKIKTDVRVQAVVLPLADGVTLALKK
jgi:predicted O-methyltransferase YrrM